MDLTSLIVGYLCAVSLVIKAVADEVVRSRNEES